MALFGKTNSFIGLDIGTSSLKLVELVDRHKRVEVSTYAKANLPNILISPKNKDSEEDAIKRVANTVMRMMDKAAVSSDTVVAALPSSIVFSTVLSLPDMPDDEMDKAVHFSAQNVVPSDIEDMVIGWSRVGNVPHMDTVGRSVGKSEGEALPKADSNEKPEFSDNKTPVFLTAAPKEVVSRYLRLINLLKLQLHALEVETFSLMRSLFEKQNDTGLVVDIGDFATTFHIIDVGTPRVSHTVEYGGHNMTTRIAKRLGINMEVAEDEKVKHGLNHTGSPALQAAIQASVEELAMKAQSLLQLYTDKQGGMINKTVLIGGGANLKGLREKWSEFTGHNTIIGNPWRGLTVPIQLEKHISTLGSTYAVAVGLALRGIRVVQ